jgi:RNA polymerase sigma factor (sigma-70 family)
MGDAEQTEATDAQQIKASLTNAAAFAVLFDRHAGSLHRYLLRRVGGSAAEDLVGETFATAFRARRSYDLSYPDARPWLFGIATNLARHHWRTEGRRLRTVGSAADSADVSEDHSEEAATRVFFEAQSDLIAGALERIEDVYLDVLLLIAGAGFSYGEVSIALGIPVGTVRSRMSRARKQLRELLGASWQYLDEGSPIVQPSVSTEGSP